VRHPVDFQITVSSSLITICKFFRPRTENNNLQVLFPLSFLLYQSVAKLT